MLKVKPFLFILFLTVFAALLSTGCSNDSSSSGGGIYNPDSSGGGIYNPDGESGGGIYNPDGEEEKVTPIDLAGNPLSLLGVYDVILYGINEEPNTPAMKSELRVGLNLEAPLEAAEVLMSLDFEGKQILFDKYVIDLSGLESEGGDLDKFIADTFDNLGAELIEGSEYGLYFTLDPAKNRQYKPILEKSIVKDGQYLKLKLRKTNDIKVNGGLDVEPAGPDAPVTIPVENIVIDTQSHSYFRGSNITIEFSITPSNTSDTEVDWATNSNGSGTITCVNGKGELVLSKVMVDDTVTLTIKNGKTAQFQITLTDSIENISFIKSSYQLTQNETQTIAIDNYDIIKNQISSLQYTSSDANIASVDNNGSVKALKNGVVTITATATSNGKNLSASYELDVLGLVDFSSNDSFIASAQGTYNITFFGTNPGKASGFMGGQTEVPVTTDCELYKELFNSTKCEGGGFVKNIIVNKDKFVGKATITIQDDGSAVIHTKILMTAESMAKNSPNDQYQYSVYRTTNRGDSNNSNNTVQGITGRHLTANGTWATSTFDVRQYKNNLSKEIILYSHLIGKEISIPIAGNKTVNPITYVIMSKESSQPEKMGYSDISVAPFNKVTGINPTDLGKDAPNY